MPNQELLTSQKNAVHDAITAEELDPGQFAWENTNSLHHGSLVVSRIVLRANPDFYFLFDYKDGKHFAEFSPGEDRRVESRYPGSWSIQLDYFSNWAGYVRRELEAPDLWGEVERHRQAFQLDVAPEIREEPFSAREAREIREALERLEEQIRENYELTKQQSQFISGRLRYLSEAVENQGRFTWIHTAIGVLITIAVTLTPQDLANFWGYVRAVFEGHFPVPLLP